MALLSVKLLITFAALALSTAIPRSPLPSGEVQSGSCCFSLKDSSSGKTVQQKESNGYLYLGADEPNGFYCIDLSNSADVLRDNFYNACFLNPEQRLICLDPTIGPNAWTLTGSDKLAHDGKTGYMACPDEAGGELLWGGSKDDAGSCRSVSLKATGFKGSC